jgi:hypothetical protein
LRIESGTNEPNSGQSSVKADGDFCAEIGRGDSFKKLVLTISFATIADIRGGTLPANNAVL